MLIFGLNPTNSFLWVAQPTESGDATCAGEGAPEPENQVGRRQD